MSESLKIGIACFIGGALCTAISLAASPGYWWLGLIAGLVAGYLAYDVREVGRGVYKAAQESGFFEWFHGPHPYLYLATALAIPAYLAFNSYMPRGPNAPIDTAALPARAGMHLFVFLVILGGMMGIQFVLAVIGTDGPIESPTYSTVYRAWARGLLRTAMFFLCHLWILSWILACKAFPRMSRFTRTAFVYIHSQRRVLCAIDGTIGGAAAYLWLAEPHMTVAAQLALVGFGGFLGTGCGVLNWEVVSKHLLKVPVSG